MSDQPSSAHPPPAYGRGRTPGWSDASSGPRDNSGWVTGGVTFAGVLMLVNGVLFILQGIAAIAKDNLYVSLDSYIYRINLTGWGWILLILGVVAVLVGCGILGGQIWARMTGIMLASLSLVAQFLFLPYAPIWSVIMMALDVFVIWALAVYHPARAET
ncbi:hypothetical protein ABZ840_06655 [Streptomyces sp. NPDC047117]|uniref:DUF7144 family membrane protein n=1 Tax=unclassified Streptomyces TaxID=2593676 RepID=UPI0033E2F57B